jgi:tetratricopeptide (TPR) repeat protein
MSLGRSVIRFGQMEESVRLLRQSIVVAQPLGDEAYETLVVAQLMLGGILPWLGRHNESEAVFERVIGLCRERGDSLHLAAALGNRVHLWVARKAVDRVLADLRENVDLARKIANTLIERNALHNLVQFLYWHGELDAALPHVARILELDERRHGAAARPEGLLFQARIQLARGDEAVVRALLGEIERRQAWAHAEGKHEALLVPNEEVLLDMVELSLRDGSDDEWEALLARSRTSSVDQELIEVLDVRGRAAARLGRVDEARRAWKDALTAAERIPNVMSERIERALGSLDLLSATRL